MEETLVENTLLSSEKPVTKKQWTRQEIRKLLYTNEDQSLTYRLVGQISLRIIPFFLRWNIAPNTITFLFIGSLVLASIVLALRPRDGVQIVALLIIASYILDSIDGPVARLSGRTSSVGYSLDMLGHWITNNLLILGATLGEIGVGGSNTAWLIGMVAMIGTNSYYYMQHALLPYSPLMSSARKKPTGETEESPPENNVSILKRIRNLLHEFYPVDTNLLIVASLIGLPFLGIQIWAVMSNVATLVIFGQYYWRETRKS
jgi:phosphatidylglycerophosphate synthase